MAQHITDEDFKILREACDILDNAGIDYVIGGGTAVEQWGRNRRTKDFDIFLNRKVLLKAMDSLSLAGYLTTDTEKNWLYKVWRGDTLIDFIVETRGGIQVDRDTMARSRMVKMRGYTFRLMGPEDTLYRKALTLTEGRPDWYDGISIIERQKNTLDWNYLVYRAQWYRRRFLAFLLFAQTELHSPPGAPPPSSGNYLYEGNDPGPIPEWVIFNLVAQQWLGENPSPHHLQMLESHLRRAA